MTPTRGEVRWGELVGVGNGWNEARSLGNRVEGELFRREGEDEEREKKKERKIKERKTERER